MAREEKSRTTKWYVSSTFLIAAGIAPNWAGTIRTVPDVSPGAAGAEWGWAQPVAHQHSARQAGKIGPADRQLA